MELISYYKVPSGGQGSIVLQNIPQIYTDLVLFVSIRTSYGTSNASFGVHLNGVSSDHISRVLTGNGSSAGSFAVTNRPYDFWVNGATSTALVFGNTMITIPDYAGSTVKTLITNVAAENNANAALVASVVSQAGDTSPITSISLIPDSASTIQENSSVTLYGITAGSDGTTTVS